jgi:hypothetical protein
MHARCPAIGRSRARFAQLNNGRLNCLWLSRDARMFSLRSRRFCDNASGGAGAIVKHITCVLLQLRYWFG